MRFPSVFLLGTVFKWSWGFKGRGICLIECSPFNGCIRFLILDLPWFKIVMFIARFHCVYSVVMVDLCGHSPVEGSMYYNVT